MEREDQGTGTVPYETVVKRIFDKCRGLDEKMRKEGKRPIVTDTLKGFIPPDAGPGNAEQALEYILDLEGEIDSLISHFESEGNPDKPMGG